MTTSPQPASLVDVPESPRAVWRNRLLLGVLGALFTLATTLALTADWPAVGHVALRVGTVSQSDLRAPQSIEYISEVLTEEARAAAESRVVDVYEPVRRVRGEQLARAREVIGLITTLRHDPTLSPEQKLAELAKLPDVQLEAEEWKGIMALDDDAWTQVSEQVTTVLSFVLLGEIRDNQLAAVRRRIPSFVDLVNEEQARAAAALARALTKPNMAYNEERTLALRREARAAVVPQIERYEAGEIIIRAGDLVNARHIEALQALGLNKTGWDWQRAGVALIVSLVIALIFGLFAFFAEPELATPRRMGLLVALLLTFLLLAKLMIPERTVLPYMFPLAAVTMLIGAMLNLPLAFLAAIFFGVIASYLGNSVNLVVYLILGSLAGVLTLRKGERTGAFISAGAAVCGVNLALLLAFNPPGKLDWTGIWQLALAGIANGAASASIALIGFYLLGAIFDIATPLRLMELARPNHPLLRDLVTKAPGTYHHSLLVSNMAEQAAEAIGADTFLTRVGAYYHDIGKINRPYFFVENRMAGVDPHTQLDPRSSAQLILNHVKDGMEMARRYKLPRQVRDFIAEHQGTGLVRFFYHEAQKAAGEDAPPVDEKDFRYPGPKPRSRETALVMLADSCESAVRANQPENLEQIDDTVRKVINQKLIEGELSQSPLTLIELETTRRIFVQALQGARHPRVVYPETSIAKIAKQGSDETIPTLSTRHRPSN